MLSKHQLKVKNIYHKILEPKEMSSNVLFWRFKTQNHVKPRKHFCLTKILTLFFSYKDDKMEIRVKLIWGIFIYHTLVTDFHVRICCFFMVKIKWALGIICIFWFFHTKNNCKRCGIIFTTDTENISCCIPSATSTHVTYKGKNQQNKFKRNKIQTMFW